MIATNPAINNVLVIGVYLMHKLAAKDEVHSGAIRADKVDCVQCHSGIAHVYAPAAGN